MKLRFQIFFILLLSLSCLQTFAQNKKAALEKYFSTLVQNQQFNGNVLVAENGKIIYEKSFGYADFDAKILNTKNTSFPIASVSKTIAATAVFQLAQARKLNVSEAVVKHLTDFPYPNITIQHLLSHTSGLPPYNAFFDSIREQNPKKVFTNADFMNGITTIKKPLIYQPGDRGNYDNINFIVIALIIEKVSGLAFEDYVRKYILEPAGMSNTFFYPLTKQYTETKKRAFAHPHLFPHLYSDSVVKAIQVPYVVNYWSVYGFTGFGDYASTTRDLLKYDEAYYNGRLVNKEMLEKIFTPVKLNNGNNNPGNFGLSWQIEKDDSLGKIVYHSGAATGLSCVLLRNISKHQTIILFDNTHSNAREVASNALKVLNGKQVTFPKRSIAKIYARILLRNGSAAARDTLNRLRKDSSNYYLNEDEINSIGYDFMGGVNNPNPFRFPEGHKYQEALETFKLNMELFPESWNVYDSYGEVLLLLGQKDEAIKMYKKSIELNPKNEGGKKVLENLLK